MRIIVGNLNRLSSWVRLTETVEQREEMQGVWLLEYLRKGGSLLNNAYEERDLEF